MTTTTPHRASPTGLLAIGLAGATLVAAIALGPSTAQGDDAQLVTPRPPLAGEELRTIELFDKARRSVVFISPTRRTGRLRMDVTEIPTGTGSGFVWDRDGHIVTNYHVIQNATGARVTLADGSEYVADLVGYSATKDLAVLRIDASPSKLVPLPVGTSHDLRVGQTVYAIGNPFGLDHTLTKGVVSALDREIRAPNGELIAGVIQSDAAINPGNSGGPLLDSAGRLIGVNTMIFSPTGSSAGIGFSVPVDTVRRWVPDLIADGRISRPGLGITVNQEFNERAGLRGVLVVDVTEGSAAERSGLRPSRRGPDGELILGDVILEVEGMATRSVNDLLTTVEQFSVGDRVTLTILRDGERVEVPLTLQSIGN